MHYLVKILRRKPSPAVFLLLLFLLACPPVVQAAASEKIDAATRCSVCGMFVVKYDNWIAQIRLADDSVLFFDGVKDLMVFYHDPGQYSQVTSSDIKEVWVRDYYSLQWHEGRKAYYVIGSDVYGPMGKEFIPFASRPAAENFLADHKGKKVILFDEITDDLVQSMRSGMKMRHGEQ